MKTFDDDYCTDVMTYDVIDAESGILNLTEDDKMLLIDYAPLLFNTHAGPDLKEVMIDLARHLNSYRVALLANKVVDIMVSNYQPTKSRTKTEISKSFTKHATALLEIMGDLPNHTSITAPQAVDLKRELKTALANPEAYIPEKKVSAAKDKIRAYLVALQLKGKSTTINNFITAIK